MSSSGLYSPETGSFQICWCCNFFQMIHFLTMALGGEGYLNFMGNEVSCRSPTKPSKLMELVHIKECLEIFYQ